MLSFCILWDIEPLILRKLAKLSIFLVGTYVFDITFSSKIDEMHAQTILAQSKLLLVNEIRIH